MPICHCSVLQMLSSFGIICVAAVAAYLIRAVIGLALGVWETPLDEIELVALGETPTNEPPAQG